jgi:hypothetical protein
MARKMSYRDFQFALAWDMQAHDGQELKVQMPLGAKLPSTVSNTGRLNSHGTKHWPLPSK